MYASAASLVEIRDILNWFGVDRSRPAICNWCYSFDKSHEQMFTAKSDRVAVNETQVQLAEERDAWLYAAIAIDSKDMVTIQKNLKLSQILLGEPLSVQSSENGALAQSQPANKWLSGTRIISKNYLKY